MARKIHWYEWPEGKTEQMVDHLAFTRDSTGMLGLEEYQVATVEPVLLAEKFVKLEVEEVEG